MLDDHQTELNLKGELFKIIFLIGSVSVVYKQRLVQIFTSLVSLILSCLLLTFLDTIQGR